MENIDMKIAFNTPLQMALIYETPKIKLIMKNGKKIGYYSIYKTYTNDIYKFKHLFNIKSHTEN